MSQNFHIALKSRNAKVGPIPVMTSSKETCPDCCPLKGGNGCYAEAGPLDWHWGKVTRGERGGTLDACLEPIRQLPDGALWRFGQAGDLPGNNLAIDPAGLDMIATAAKGKRTILYTHKPPTRENVALLEKARDEHGLHVNLSGNSPRHADMLAKTGFDVVTILPSEYGRTFKKAGKVDEWTESLAEYKARIKELPHTTPAGRRIAVCPATYLDTNCKACGLCAHARNGAVVGFPAHGASHKKATATASA